MDTQDFQLLAELLKMRSGLMVTPAQTGLMESRLLPVAHLHGLHSISQLCAVLRIAPTYTLRMDVCEAMATGETSFFRDITPYAYFCGTVLPLLMQNNAAQTLRIWSAACATGQEPYTIAMCIEEERTALAGREVEILASDFSAKMLVRARAGIYSQFEAQRGLPIQLLVKYFTPLPDTSWQVGERLRGSVQCLQQNLLDTYNALGVFDSIFCRNVLIYFDTDTKLRIIAKLARALQPGGVLVLGTTEMLPPTHGFEPMGLSGVYRKITA